MRIYKNLISFGKSGWIKWSEIESSNIVIHYLGEKKLMLRWRNLPNKGWWDFHPWHCRPVWIYFQHPSSCPHFQPDASRTPRTTRRDIPMSSLGFSWELRNETPINLLPLVSPLKKNVTMPTCANLQPFHGPITDNYMSFHKASIGYWNETNPKGNDSQSLSNLGALKSHKGPTWSWS